MKTIEIIFWICAILVVYTYVGYGILLIAIVKIKKIFCSPKLSHKPTDDSSLPEVTLMVCAYNEEDIVDKKMENTHALDYPKDKLRVMWVTDGSDDSTNEKLKAYSDAIVLFEPKRAGKTAAMNRGMGYVDTDIVILTDANTMINSQAIRVIVGLMADPKVACVAGEKRVAARNETQGAAQGEGLYWKYESTLKRYDYQLNSAMGAAGELCAIRKSLYEPMPTDTLLDDFIMSMRTLEKGYKIAYSPDAYAMEYGSANLAEESKRKRRIAAGGLQSVWRLRSLMNPFKHPLTAFQFVSHRVLRWTITPLALLALIPLNVALVFCNAGAIYTAIWVMQIIFYLAVYVGYIQSEKAKKNKLCFVCYFFFFMNLNVFKGIAYLRSHRQSGIWERAKRS